MAIVCLTLLLCIASLQFISNTGRACFVLSVKCEDASIYMSDGGAVDVEYNKITPCVRRVAAGGEYDYKINISYGPGCGSIYPAKLAVLPVQAPAGWKASLTDGSGANLWGRGLNWHDYGGLVANLSVKSPPSAVAGDTARITVRIWANDTDACNEHDTVDVSTETVINPYPNIGLALNSPAGGEIWTGGSVQNITWTAIGGKAPLTLKLEYSVSDTDGPWVPLADDEPNDGSYQWTVPKIPSYVCSVRIMAWDSDAPSLKRNFTGGLFTIKTSGTPPLTVTLILPNGGLNWQPGWNCTIQWFAAGGLGTLKIRLEYSTDGPAGPWKLIVNNMFNGGSYRWKIPAAQSANCYVKVIVNDGASPQHIVNDTSDKAFSIGCPVTEMPALAVLGIGAAAVMMAGIVWDGRRKK